MAAMLVSQGKKRCGNGKTLQKEKKKLMIHLSSYINVIRVVHFIEAVLEWLVY